jgi:hypothetical protein
MSQTTQCPSCGVVLTLPDGAEARRLKCPKCGNRFVIGEGKPPSNRPSSSGSHRPASSLLLKPPHDDPGVPTADRDLRDTFAPDLLFGEEKPSSPPKGIPSKNSAPPPGDIGDAAALLQEDDLPSTRRRGPSAADRAQSRRCPTCGSVVPAGMSLCGRCGLDLDTGQRTQIDDILEAVAPPRRPTGPPLIITLLGGLALVASLALTVVALVKSARPDATQGGYLSLALVGGFGIYAAVQFLRLKSAKLLLVALMLGALVNTVALIGLPLYQAFTSVRIVEGTAPLEAVQIENVTSRLDVNRLRTGIFILLLDAAAMIAVVSPPVRKHFERTRSNIPIGV